MKIRSDIIQTYQILHTWTGIVAGLFLFIGFFAGALTMFKPVLTEWAEPASFHLPQISEGDLDTLVAKAYEKHERLQDNFTVNFDQNLSPLTWYETTVGRELKLDNIERHATLNAEGALTSMVAPSNELGTLIDQLHRTAGIVGKVGHEDLGLLIMGGAGVLYFLALISGIIYLLPKMVRTFFSLKNDRGGRRFWRDSHNLVSLTSFPFHLIIAWTVVVFCFHDVFYGGLSLVYGDKPMFNLPAPSRVVYERQDMPPVSAHIQKVEEYAGDYELMSLTYSGLTSPRPTLIAMLSKDGEMMRGPENEYLYMNPYNLEPMFSTIYTEDSTAYGPLVSSFFALHVGNYGGSWLRWLYFVMGIVGAFVFYSGNMLWLEKRRKKRGEQQRSYRVMAALTIGTCIGSVLGVAAAMLAARWGHWFTEAINYSYLWAYYTAFFAALVYSFARGAARAAIHLLLLLAVTCLLIPVTSLLSYLLPDLGLWAPSHLSTVMVDVMALVFAVTFYGMARATRHRAYNGEENSVWHIPAEESEAAFAQG